MLQKKEDNRLRNKMKVYLKMEKILVDDEMLISHYNDSERNSNSKDQTFLINQSF